LSNLAKLLNTHGCIWVISLVLHLRSRMGASPVFRELCWEQGATCSCCCPGCKAGRGWHA
jgi:hypothetical protein